MNVLETHVLEMIGENTSSPDVFEDTDTGIEQIRDSICDAIEEITMLTGSYKEIYRVPLIADQSFYRMKLQKNSIGWITDVWLVNEKYRLDQTDSIKISYNNPRWLNSTGSPREYLPVGNDIIGVYPKPSATSDLLEVTMVIIPEPYTAGTDRIKLRDSFKWACVHYAVSEYYASRGDAFQAIDHHKKYLEGLGLQKLYPQSNERQYNYKTAKA